MTKQVNGGTSTEKHVKAVSPLFKGTKNGKSKVSTNGRARRAEFVQRYGKVIASTWAGLTGKSRSLAGVQKKLPELNTWQIDYALVKLGLKKSTSPSMLQWIKDDEVKAPVVKKVKASKPKMNKALAAREKKEAASVARFKASSTPSEVVCAGLK